MARRPTKSKPQTPPEDPQKGEHVLTDQEFGLSPTSDEPEPAPVRLDLDSTLRMVDEVVTRCPCCGSGDTTVKDTYKPDGVNTVYRKRLCRGCGKHFRTVGAKN